MDELNTSSGSIPPVHYYGDLIRKLFMVGAAVMVVGLPFVGSYISMPTFVSVLAILVLGILAGLTNPRHVWVTVVNTIISVIAFVLFEIYAIKFYYANQAYFFVVNQGLSLLFLAATYYSTKTWRGMPK